MTGQNGGFVEVVIDRPADIDELFIGYRKNGQEYELAKLEPPAKMRIEPLETE